MAGRWLRLLSSTNWTLALNATINHPGEHGGGESGLIAVTSQDNRGGFLHPTSSSADTEKGICSDWQDTQHALFQLANLCTAASLLTPSTFRHHLFFLRCLLAVAYLLFIAWASFLICMLDALVWNLIFFVVNFVHVTTLAYSNIPSRLNTSLSEFYHKKMKPLKVGRQDFAEFCNMGEVVLLRKGNRYSTEGHTSCGERVSFLLRGRLRVCHEGIFLHSIEQNEFVDSPEFDSLLLHSTESCDKFQVTITAADDSLIISWMYPTLRSYFACNQFLATVFTNVIGKDISDKLYRIQELLLKSPEETSAMNRNSSMVNVRRYLQSTDTGEPEFTNGEIKVNVDWICVTLETRLNKLLVSSGSLTKTIIISCCITWSHREKETEEERNILKASKKDGKLPKLTMEMCFTPITN